MKIDYEILWFEDQPNELEHDIASIEDFLAESGFTLRCTMKETITADQIADLANQLRRYNKYDLIVLDYDLGASGNGSDIAHRLRQSVFTDMVFYSGKPVDDLRKILYEKGIDGVFLVGRDNFASSLEDILEDHTRKACDVNVIRGVVMDEVSRFDRILRQICQNILENNGGELSNATHKKLIKRMKTRGNEMVKKSKEITCPIACLNDHKLSDFNIVRNRLMVLMREIGGDAEFFEEGAPLAEMQKLRNRLAHITGNADENGVMTLSDDLEEKFDYDKFREIRKNLRDIGGMLDSLNG